MVPPTANKKVEAVIVTDATTKALFLPNFAICSPNKSEAKIAVT